MTLRRAGRLAGMVGVVVGCALVVSCAARTDPRAPGAAARPLTTSTVRAPTPATNRARTQVEVQRLLALASLPPGRHVLGHGPKSLRWPGGGAPLTTSLVDVARFWRVSMPLEQAVDWVGAHPPVGLTLSGMSGDATSISTRSTGSTTSGYSYSDRSSRYWTGAELDVTVAADGRGATDWRIDGIAEWLDPRPMRDSGSGPRVHVSAATGCPSSDRGVVGVTNSGPGLDHDLLPPARPTGALVCRYVGVNGTEFTLRRPRTLSAAQAGRLAIAARAVPLRHVDGLTYACPSGDGSADVIAFAYADRTVDLWYTDYGCISVANGAISTVGSIAPFGDAIRPWLR